MKLIFQDLTPFVCFKKSFGGWATFDDVPSQAYARNQLSITAEMKKDVGYVAEVEITQPINAHIGIVGPQNFAAGGGNQLHFILSAQKRGEIFKFLGGKKLP